MCAPRLIGMYQSTSASYVWHDSFMCVSWLIHVCTKTYLYMEVDFCLIWVTWLIHVCELTYSCVHQDLFVHGSRLLPHTLPHTCDTRWPLPHTGDITQYVCEMTKSCVWNDSFMCVKWLSHVCEMTKSCVWNDKVMCVNWLSHVCTKTYLNVQVDFCVISDICWPLPQMCDIAPSCLWTD